jgi:non-specific serine/threonine protein kinase
MAKLTAETISTDLLKNHAGAEIFHQGQLLYRWGRVIIDKVLEDRAQCRVNNNRPFVVEINLDGPYLYLKCECKFAAKGNICEHDVAAALALQDYLQKNQVTRWQYRINKVLQSTQNQAKKTSVHPFLLFFSLQNASNLGMINWKIIPYHLPISALPKDIRSRGDHLTSRFVHELIQKQPGISAHLKTPYKPLEPEACVNCQKEGVVLANLLIDRTRNAFSAGNVPIHEFLSLLSSANSPIYLGSTIEPLQKNLQILLGPAEVRLQLDREQNGLRISAAIYVQDQAYPLNTGAVQIVSYNPFLLLVEDTILEITDENQIELLKNFSESTQIFISDNEVPEFLDKYYLPLAQSTKLSGEAVSWENIEAEPAKRIYLSEGKGELQAQLKFSYGDFEVSYDSRFPEYKVLRKPDSWTLVKVVRKPGFEENAYQQLSTNLFGLKKSPFAPQPGIFVLRSRTNPIDFLLHTIPLLIQHGYEVFGEEKLKSNRVNRHQPTIAFKVSSGIDWFDVKLAVNFGETEVSIKEIRKLFKRNEKFIKLSDGTIGEIPAEWLERYRHLFAFGEETNEGIRLGKHHITLLDQIIEKQGDAIVDEGFRKQQEKIKSYIEKGFEGIKPHLIPTTFKGELRPYQKAGFDWLYFLHDLGFGGCLADDMGLGKTIQALAFFQSIYENNIPAGKASLVVVPRSLLANWQREASKFSPGLKVLEYFESDRPKDISVFDEYHLVFTTYGVLLRDINELRTYPFYYVLLDESQLIKNPQAQTAKAARLLQSSHKLVLTGTPIENSTLELWSQFAFLNPGLLGNLEYFKNEFSGPIERRNDDQALEFLRKLVFPFILRRTKEQVAPELPPRTEKLLYSDMEPAQRKLYNRTKEYYRALLVGMAESDGVNGTRMKILEGLLRLRQISNHPSLFDHHFRGESGKFELLIETLETLRAEGHKSLIFSQFVQMLSLVRKALDERHIPYTYLDGQTQNRQEQVDKFQEDPGIPFFLISLKAGGLGLNLTAADYVIHIDPWWNPAVEMQATDRTHRIGQEKPVIVYKLITRESVEEKILQLQDKKKELVDQIITSEANFFKDISVEDIKVLFS